MEIWKKKVDTSCLGRQVWGGSHKWEEAKVQNINIILIKNLARGRDSHDL